MSSVDDNKLLEDDDGELDLMGLDGDFDLGVEDEDALLADDNELDEQSDEHQKEEIEYVDNDGNRVTVKQEYYIEEHDGEVDEEVVEEEDVLELNVNERLDELDSDVVDNSEILGEETVIEENEEEQMVHSQSQEGEYYSSQESTYDASADVDTVTVQEAETAEEEDQQHESETLQVVVSTSDTKVEDSEEEDQAEEEEEGRSRFKSERTTLISLKPRKSFGKIPDSLDSVLTTDETVATNRGNWGIRGNRRGQMQGRGYRTQGSNVPIHSNSGAVTQRGAGNSSHKIHINPHFRGHVEPHPEAWNTNKQRGSAGDGLQRPPPFAHNQMPFRPDHPPYHDMGGSVFQQQQPQQNMFQPPRYQGPQDFSHPPPFYRDQQQQPIPQPWSHQGSPHQFQPPPQHPFQQGPPPPYVHQQGVGVPPMSMPPPPQQNNVFQPPVDNSLIRILPQFPQRPPLRPNFHHNGPPPPDFGALRPMGPPPTNIPVDYSRPPPNIRGPPPPQQQQQQHSGTPVNQHQYAGSSSHSGMRGRRGRGRFPVQRGQMPKRQSIQPVKRPSFDNSGYIPVKQSRMDTMPVQLIKKKKWSLKPINTDNLHEVKVVDLPDSTADSSMPSRMEEDDEDEETREYRKKIEEQKRQREKILRQKEARRKMAALQKQKELNQQGETAEPSDIPLERGSAIATVVNQTRIEPSPVQPSREPLNLSYQPGPPPARGGMALRRGFGRARGIGRARGMVPERSRGALIQVAGRGGMGMPLPRYTNQNQQATSQPVSPGIVSSGKPYIKIIRNEQGQVIQKKRVILSSAFQENKQTVAPFNTTQVVRTVITLPSGQQKTVLQKNVIANAGQVQSSNANITNVNRQVIPPGSTSQAFNRVVVLNQRGGASGPVRGRGGAGPQSSGRGGQVLVRGASRGAGAFTRGASRGTAVTGRGSLVQTAGRGRGCPQIQNVNVNVKNEPALQAGSRIVRLVKQTVPDQQQQKSGVATNTNQARGVVGSTTKSSTVTIENLSASTTESSIRKMCVSLGPVESVQMNPAQCKATIKFKNAETAFAFYKRYERKLIDLSLITVKFV